MADTNVATDTAEDVKPAAASMADTNVAAETAEEVKPATVPVDSTKAAAIIKQIEVRGLETADGSV